MASLTFICISVLLAAASADRPITCAVVPVAATDDGQFKVIALLEQRLARDPKIQLVERAAFDAILQEQQLQLALMANGTEARHRLGQILRAEFLILVEQVETNGRPAVRLVVAETKLGLRLMVETYPWADTAVRKLVDDMVATLSRARLLWTEDTPTIVAVPPFECEDFTFEHNQLTYTYAALVERSLLRIPGVVVIELEEARAIADELRLSPGEKNVSRPLPLYVIGKYRTRGCGDVFCVSFELTLRQDDAVLQTVSAADVSSIRIAAQLDAQIGTMMEALTGHGPSRAASAQQEIHILNERAARFRQLGEWEEALALIEASLLLDSRQMALHVDAVRMCTKLSRAYYDPYGTIDDFSRKATRGLSFHRAGLTHLEHILRTKTFRWSELMNFMSEYWASARGIEQYSGIPNETRQLCRSLALEKREILLNILEEKARDGTLSYDLAYLIPNYLFVEYTDLREPREKNYAIRLRAIQCLLKLHDAKTLIIDFARIENLHAFSSRPDPAYYAFLDQLEALPGDAVRLAVIELRRELEKEISLDEARRRRAKRSIPPIARKTDEANEVAFHRIRPCLLQDNGSCTAIAGRLSGWLRGGAGTDVVYELKSLFVMKEKGRLRRVFRSSDRFFNIRSVCFDGRYVWAPVVKRTEPLVILLDPKTEQTWRFTKEDGLPPTSGQVAATPVAIGAAVVSGSFVNQGARKSWIAILRFDERGGKSVDVIHEARYQPETPLERAHPTLEAEIAFTPRFIVPLYEPDAPENRRFLINIYRRTGILVDVAQRSIELQPHACAGQGDAGVTSQDGFGYWLSGVGGNDRGSTLWRVGFPDFQAIPIQTAFAGDSNGNILFAQGQVHAVGRFWWTADDVDGDFRKVATEIPGRWYLRQFCKSNHYGDVLLTSRNGVYKVVLGTHAGEVERRPPDGN